MRNESVNGIRISYNDKFILRLKKKEIKDKKKIGESLSNLQSYKVFKVCQSCQSLSKFVKVCQSCQSLSKLCKLH